VWEGLTLPELVKQYFFGTQMVTTWVPGTPIFFRGEWEGTPYEDKGTVLKYEPQKMLQYDYLSSFSNLEDRPENYQTIIYRVKSKGNSTVLSISQRNIDTLEKKVHAVGSWTLLANSLKKLMEGSSI
jgi:uncharacterized protein YndB with AHSA1/START domain